MWEKVQIAGDKENGTAFHAMCACYPDKTTSISFSKDKEKDRAKQKVHLLLNSPSQFNRILKKVFMFSEEKMVKENS